MSQFLSFENVALFMHYSCTISFLNEANPILSFSSSRSFFLCLHDRDTVHACFARLSAYNARRSVEQFGEFITLSLRLWAPEIDFFKRCSFEADSLKPDRNDLELPKTISYTHRKHDFHKQRDLRRNPSFSSECYF